MGKPTGFLEFYRENNQDIPVRDRILNFEEFHHPLPDHARMEQAGRCMNCGVPLCQSAMVLGGMVTGCPLHNLIPEWNDQIWAGHPEHAWSRLSKTSNFPEFTGRVCPALCEKACICGQYDEPVTIHDNELWLIETAFEKGFIKPRIPAVRSGKKVAVVGSGPSGLAVADELNHRGHSVTVFEREDRIGGLLMYGIPNMKLDKRVIARRQALMETEGVTFCTGTDIGRDREAGELLRDYDAVVLCCGAKKPRELQMTVKNLQGEAVEFVSAGGRSAGSGDLRVSAEEIRGIRYAVDYLRSATRSLLEAENLTAASLKKQGGYIDASGKHVVIIGGGDTGNDCIGTAIRQGCHSVTALEMMPEPPLVRDRTNPWPQWPKVRKTDYGHEEAVELFGKDPRVYETTVKECLVNKRRELKKIRTVKVRFENGKLCEVPGTEQLLPCDLLLVAAGFTGCEEYTPEAFGLTRTPKGTISTLETESQEKAVPGSAPGESGRACESRFRTGAEKVFAAGDMRRGQSLVVWAIAEGRACAREVDTYLMGYTGLQG